MKLNNLYPHFKNKSSEQQAEFIHNYRLQREKDFDAKKKTVRLLKKDLTSEVQLMMKVLDITVTDLNRLRKNA